MVGGVGGCRGVEEEGGVVVVWSAVVVGACTCDGWLFGNGVAISVAAVAFLPLVVVGLGVVLVVGVGVVEAGVLPG